MQAALPVARRWYHAHRHEYQATADGVQVLWHPFWHPAMVLREPGVIDLMNVIRQRDVEFAEASAGVQRLIVSALIPRYRSQFAKEMSGDPFPLEADQSDQHRLWQILASYAFDDEFEHCRRIVEATRNPEPPAGLLVYYKFPALWRCCLGFNVAQYWLGLIPLTVGLILSVTLSAMPWGAFYVVRRIAQTFGGTA
jgi:hypothetical protein